MNNTNDSQFINFLTEELAVPLASVSIAMRHWQHDPGPLSMILWQYGFVSLEQLEKILDWQDTYS